MLYDKKWDAKKWDEKTRLEKAQEIESLIAWLSTQDPSAKYDYGDTSNCLFCQYYRAMGFKVDSAGGEYTRVRVNGKQVIISTDYQGPVSACGERTFGAALERAKAARK